MTAPQTPPGWYPDPSGAPGLQRYWDGYQWSAAAVPGTGTARTGMSTRTRVTLVLGGVGAIAVLGVVGNMPKQEASTPSSAGERASTAALMPNSGAEPTLDTPRTPTVAPAGSAVRDGKFEFRVLDISSGKTVSDPTGNPFMTATAQGTFVVVRLSVRNIGDVPQNYFGQNQKLIDVAGREYGVSSAANMYMNAGDSVMGDINPGNSIEVDVPFDVPPGTSIETLEVHDSMFSGGALVAIPGIA